MFWFTGDCNCNMLAIFVWLFTLCMCSAVKNEDQRNLAWKLVKGFAKIWNHTDQGVCVTLPESAEQGLQFFIIPLNLSFVLNMTSVAAPLPLPEQWTSKKNRAQIEWRGTSIVHNVYQTYDSPSDAPHEGELHKKYCRTRCPKVNIAILSQIESPHPAIKLRKSKFGPETITFEEYNAKQPCLVY